MAGLSSTKNERCSIPTVISIGVSQTRAQPYSAHRQRGFTPCWWQASSPRAGRHRPTWQGMARCWPSGFIPGQWWRGLMP
jgi:hypothetical protein